MSIKITFSVFCFLVFFNPSFSQDCNTILSDVNKAVLQAENNLDSILNLSSQPNYVESYIIYPVISRYYNKSKNKDTALVRRFEDFARTVWCFKGTCFSNNKSFYLNKKEIIEKIQNNDLGNSYQRETICMLCDKYYLDSSLIIKLLNYTDTLISADNINADNYSLLHKALQLINLKSNKCINNEIFERYKFTLMDTIYKKFVIPFVQQNNDNIRLFSNDYDLYSEALLMISVLDDKINISNDLYALIIKNQLKGGGWSLSSGGSDANGHSTIVSLWTLLDYQKKLRIVLGKSK